MKGKRHSFGFYTAVILVSVFYLAILELSKNTILGWIITFLSILSIIGIRRALFKKGAYDGTKSALAWLIFMVTIAVNLGLTAPRFKRVPAVEGFKVEKTAEVTVTEGKLTGVYNKAHTVEIYAGIPYAKPPVGTLRWKAPEAPEKYEGVLACDSYGPMAMQKTNFPLYDSLYQILGFHKYRMTLFDDYKEPVSEDCLYLNIYKPADYSGEPLPVLFYVHGGSLTTGQSYYTEYRGETLAEKGVIFVNFAYRLGVFGYYANEELAAESPDGTTGNYGLLDQIAALKWVHENIAAFGGDPDNITIAGESAGSSSVNALCVSPLTEGLFERAIAESSSILAKKPYHTFRTMESALDTGRKILDEFDVTSVNGLRNISASKLVNTKYPNSSMTVDGYAIVEQPYLTYQKGKNHEKALLNGFNAKEADAFLLGNKATTENYTNLLKPIVGKYATELAALVPPGSVKRDQTFFVDAGGEAKGSLCEVYSAAWFTYSHWLWSNYVAAEERPVYEYYFTKSNNSLSNFHAGELPYAYGNLWRAPGLYSDADYALSEIMQNYWVNFAKYGDPNGENLPVWKPVTKDSSKLLELSDNIAMIDDPYSDIYAILEKYQNDGE